jgi:penicillin-binding protein 2
MMTEKASSRLRVLALLVALMFVALSTRLWYLQVLAAPRLAEEARNNGRRPIFHEAVRGLIKDRNGIPLVGNQGSLEILVTPDQLGDQAEAVVVRLAELLDVPASDIAAALNDDRYYDYQTRPVSQFTDVRVAAYIAEHPEEFPGVEAANSSVRDYPLGRTAAHLLGSVGVISAADYETLKDKGYGQNDTIGRAGLERTYEKFLRGRKGRTVYVVNSDQEVIRKLLEEDPVPGDDLHLTLDAEWQQIAEEELLAGMLGARELDDSNGEPLAANAGAVVVLDAKTGAVRALASLPSFDPKWFVKGLTRQQSAYFENDRVAPLVDRTYQLAYPPGSTYKPITSLVAFHQGVASMSGSYPCTSTYTHPGDESGTVFTNWTSSNRYMGIAEALRVSCDTVFYGFGSDFYYHYVNNSLAPNAQPLQRELRQVWGFEAPTGLDAPGEAVGTIPDAAFAAEHPELYFEGDWQPGGDILLMIGAGNVQVTPLQLATAYGAIANGGRLCRPFLVDRITDAEGDVVRDPGPRCRDRLPYSAGELAYIRTALASAVSSGTAACAFSGFPLSEIPVAGKTGTAEREPYQDTSWFASMVGPLDDPDYVVVTMVEQGGFGAQTAAPITRRIIERFEELGDTPRPGCAAEEED